MRDFHKYSEWRNSVLLSKYGLMRRTEAVARTAAQLVNGRALRMLDVGTADGAMLESLQREFPLWQFIGFDSSPSLCRIARDRGLHVVQGLAPPLPFSDQAFDVVLLCSTLKHIKDYRGVLRECARVLVANGHLILSDPTPLGIWFGKKLKHFDPRYLYNVWTLQEACQRVEENGFRLVARHKYLLTPIPCPGAHCLESLLLRLGFTCTFLQQLLLAKKSS